MEECDHCSETFEDEDAYLEHLGAEHRGELGRIEQRRVEKHEDEQGGGGRTTLYVSVAAVAIIAAVGAFAVGNVFGGDGGVEQNAESPMAGSGNARAPAQDLVAAPTGYGQAHEHGPMTVQVDGQRIDFSQPQYQLQADAFHFESGNGQRYHVHANRVTLEYALETLGIGVTETSLSFNGTVYNDTNPNQRVVYRVNDEVVNPEQYVLSDGDEVEVIAERTN